MNKNYKESFEQMSIAGNLAAETLDEITNHVKPGITTGELVHLLIMSSVMEFQLTNIYMREI